jgi:tRNA 2-thiouridine synthesizing protein A
MHHDIEWDAGDLACGDLVLELRRRVRAEPGKVFRVIALDPGAPADIPAWCAMTGHALVAHDPDARAFFIRAKD